MASSRVVPRRGGLITVHELHQTIREIGQELSIDDVCYCVFVVMRGPMTSLRSVYNLTDAPYERPTEAPSISVGPPFFPICIGVVFFVS